MKKILTMVLVAILVFSMVGCSNELTNAGRDKPPEETETMEVSTGSVDEEPTETPVEEAPTATVPEEKIEVDFQEKSFIYEDKDGYKLEVTVKIAPWILQSNTEVINIAREKIGRIVIPKLNDMISGVTNKDGMYSYDNFTRRGGISVSEKFYCPSSNFDMYYAIGTISVKNITDDFEITDANPRLIPNFVFKSDAFKPNDDGYCPAVLRFLYSSPKSYYEAAGGIICGSGAQLTKNNWGPVGFVLGYAESKAPNYPDGIFREKLEDMTLTVGEFGNGFITPSVSFQLDVLE